MKQALITLLVLTLLPYGAHASERLTALPISGEERSSFGPIAGIGFDKKTSRISGFYHLKQVQMPDHSFHADCHILFAGKLEGRSKIPVIATELSGNRQKEVKGTLDFRGQSSSSSSQLPEQIFSLHLSENLPGCSRAVDVSDFDFDFSINSAGDWKSLTAVQAKRAYFHTSHDESAKAKSYVVRGDLLYIYDEVPNWLYVKFKAGKKETEGWIRRSDTVQLSNYSAVGK